MLEYKGMGAIPEVVIARIKRKNAKLLVQRDFWKSKHDHYKKIIEEIPSLEYKYNKYMNAIAEHKRVADLEKRIKEQSILIEKLIG